MNLPQLIFQNNFTKLIIIIFVTTFNSINAQSEIPEKYKIDSSLAKCKGADYKKWDNCYGEYKFPRIEYKGEWKNGAFNGQGILREAWGDIYIGDFVNNKANGYGRQDFYIDGKIIGYFEGEIKNDFLNGQATWVNEFGTYKGQFKDHMLDGYAIAEFTNGSRYEGYWKKDNYHGEGSLIWADGSKYIGNFKEGDRHNYGEMIWANGDKFVGEWNEEYMKKGEYTYINGDKFIGEYDDSEQKTNFGIFIYASGTRYEGNYINGYRTGEGKILYEDGGTYEGEFFEGLEEGNGHIKWANGDEYHGEWKDGNRDGKGEYIYLDGNKYNGNWVNNFENGFGVFEWSDGEKYVGEWEDGVRTGFGKYYYASGTIYEGAFFENSLEGDGILNYASGDKYVGQFKDDAEHGLGKMEYINGDIYEGQFDEGYRHGQGKMTYANGKIYEGLWEDGAIAEGKTTLADFTTNENYYALIIGNNDYKIIEKLDNAVNDAVDLEEVLRKKYGFKTTLLLDKTSDEIQKAVISFTDNRKKTDNLIIFYAGHGKLIKKQKLERGYWLPIDSGPTRDPNWISNNDIKDSIASSNAKHILLIVDSCFSGSLTRGSGENKTIERLNEPLLKRLKEKYARLVITSGGNEDVVDGIGDSKNSVFAEPLIDALKKNTEVIRSIELFQEVQNYVINNADQTPNHSLIHGTGHDGGDFLFFPVS